jgi:hypothetical protein
MTTQFKNFDRKNLKSLRQEMGALLASYGVSSNLDIEVGNMSFSDAEVNIKVSAKVKGAVTMTDRILQMEVDRLGLSMKNRDGDELIEYKTRSPKYAFVFRCGKTGKMFKTDERAAIRRFAS